jgi:dolichyl-phosphate-mannose--protein O-mannosyl transferase
MFIVAKLSQHLFTNTNYELHGDEMLYFNRADHLSTGYATVPPVIGFVAFIVKSIFGYSVFGIRFIPALLGAVSLFIVAKIVRELV